MSVEKHEVDSQMNLSSILQIQGILTGQNMGLVWCLKLEFFLCGPCTFGVSCGQVSLLACMVLSACYWALLNMYFKELDTEGNWFKG